MKHKGKIEPKHTIFPCLFAIFAAFAHQGDLVLLHRFSGSKSGSIVVQSRSSTTYVRRWLPHYLWEKVKQARLDNVLFAMAPANWATWVLLCSRAVKSQAGSGLFEKLNAATLARPILGLVSLVILACQVFRFSALQNFEHETLWSKRALFHSNTTKPILLCRTR